MHRNRLQLLGIALCFLPVLLAGCRGSVPDRKPGPPTTVSIEPVGELRRGATGEVAVTATALADSDDFSLDVQLPPEIALYSGSLHQRGPVRANTQFRLVFVIRVPVDGGPVITAIARLRAGDAGTGTAIATFSIGDQAVDTRTPEYSLPARRDGERLREYPLP